MIILYSGDESTTQYMLRVSNRTGKYVAEHLSPFYYYGTHTDSVWTSELNSEMVALCYRFIDKAKKLPNTCPRSSTRRERFWIELPDMTIKKSGNCDWGSLTYHNLVSALFSSHFKTLEDKRLRLAEEINRSLFGKWYFNPMEKDISRGDTIRLSRDSTSNLKTTWQFGDNYYFNASVTKYLNLNNSKKYSLDIDEGDVLLMQSDEFVKTKKGEAFYRGATFKVIELDEDRLDLVFMWN